MKKKKVGRPKQVNRDTYKRICGYIIDGISVTEIARKLGVTRQSIYRWRKADPDFEEMYKEAQLIRAEDLTEECIRIADNESRDLLEDPDTGRMYSNNAAVQRDKLKIQARTKLLQWLNPKYGQQNVDVTSNGDNIFGGLVITMNNDDEE